MGLVSLINPSNLGEVLEEVECGSPAGAAAVAVEYLWSPGIFRNKHRAIADFISLDLLVLETDQGCTVEQALDLFKSYKHVIMGSKSHRREKNGKIEDRLRIVLFLDQAVDNDLDYKATWATAYKRWPFIDPSCKDASRFFYPSPTMISMNEGGVLYPVTQAQPAVAVRAAHPSPSMGSGLRDLWKSTYKFLAEGSPAGSRHNDLIKAVGDMRECGYDKDQVLAKVQTMTEVGDWTQVGLNRMDLKAVDSMFEREMKYPTRPEDPGKSVSALIGSVESSGTRSVVSSVVTASELLEETFSYLKDKDKVRGEPTGIAGLDKMLGGGFRTGELSVLMAQAKTGKNTLYHYMIYRHLERGLPFGYASRELNPATEVIPNLLSIAMQSNAWTGDITQEYESKAREIMSRWQLYFAPGYGHFEHSAMEQWFMELRAMDVQHFLFDHFHYALEGEDYEATTLLIKRLKSITKTLDIHLSLIVQPRSLREGEELSLATLRGGASIGQALDNLLILTRVKGDKDVSRLELAVARHKLARLGDIYLKYDQNTTSFTEVDKSTTIRPRQ